MKVKNLFITLISILVLCSSCQKDIIKHFPELEGSWQWKSTLIGPIGNLNAIQFPDDNLVLDFRRDNKISLFCNEDTIFADVTYTAITKTQGSIYEYVINVPKDANEQLAAYGRFDWLHIEGKIRITDDLSINDNEIGPYLHIAKLKKDKGLTPNSVFKRVDQ